jgi:hypothetical protein
MLLFPAGVRETVVANHPKQEPFYLSSWIVGALLAALFVGAHWVLTLLFRWLRKPLIEAWELESASAWWPRLAWLLNPLRWVAGGMAALSLLAVVILLVHAHDSWTYLLGGVKYLMFTAVFGLGYNVLQWSRELHDDPEVQKRAAGRRAEKTVEKVIDEAVGSSSGYQALHGQLLVFHPGEENEFSVELDHLVVTPRRIYLVETKYKSGTIYVDAQAPQWPTASVRGAGSMRNALLQVKQSAKVLKRELDLPEIVPMVAIVGNETKLAGAPGNVVLAEDLVKAMYAFEQTAKEEAIDAKAVIAKVQRHIVGDGKARGKHNERAQAAQLKGELEAIVQTASLD